MKRTSDGRLDLPRDEMAFRKIYRDLVENRSLVTVFRPERRLCGDIRGYCEGQSVKARILDVPGSDRAGVPPRFLETPERIIKIETVRVYAFGELIPEMFQGSSPDVYDRESLKYHLGLIYNIDPAAFTDEAEITRITFRYVS